MFQLLLFYWIIQVHCSKSSVIWDFHGLVTSGTETLYQPAPRAHDSGDSICIDNEDLANVNKFKYLGSTVMCNNKKDEEIHTRMSNASISFGRLKTKVWYNKDLSFKTKCTVYRAISCLLYSMERRPGLYTG